MRLPQFGNATIGLVLSRKLINDLPLVSRNPFDLAFLAPGVSQAPGTAYGQGVSTPGFITNFISDGGRNAQADFLLDGVSVMNSDNNPGVQKALYVPPVEAIRGIHGAAGEFQRRVREQRRHRGQCRNAQRHESISWRAFEYFRNNVLNANSYFANAAGLDQAASDEE